MEQCYGCLNIAGSSLITAAMLLLYTGLLHDTAKRLDKCQTLNCNATSLQTSAPLIFSAINFRTQMVKFTQNRTKKRYLARCRIYTQTVFSSLCTVSLLVVSKLFNFCPYQLLHRTSFTNKTVLMHRVSFSI